MSLKETVAECKVRNHPFFSLLPLVLNAAVSEHVQAAQDYPVASALSAHRSHQLPRRKLLYAQKGGAGSLDSFAIERGA